MTGLLVRNRGTGIVADAYLPSPCIQNHAANLAFLPDGTLTCVWFGGTMEGMGDISIYMSRLAPGSDTWSQAGKDVDDPQKSEQNPLIFKAPDGNVWLLYTSQTSGNQDGSVVKYRISTDGGRHSAPSKFSAIFPAHSSASRLSSTDSATGCCRSSVVSAEPGERWTGDADTAAVSDLA
jgi:predicted neuraminidase